MQLHPDFFVTYYHRAWLYAQLGQYGEAITGLTKGRLLANDEGVKTAVAKDASLKKAFALEGARGFWREVQKQAETDGPEIGEFGPPQLCARLGDNENALRQLQRNYDERSPLGTLMNVDPAFDPLRSDPRFRSLLSRMGLTSGNPANGIAVANTSLP